MLIPLISTIKLTRTRTFVSEGLYTPSETKVLGHAQNGLIKNHILKCYPARNDRTKKFLNNVSILCKYKANLAIAETLYIHELEPNFNDQSEFCRCTSNLFLNTFLNLLIFEVKSGYVGLISG